jgi:hypothetical protein
MPVLLDKGVHAIGELAVHLALKLIGSITALPPSRCTWWHDGPSLRLCGCVGELLEHEEVGIHVRLLLVLLVRLPVAVINCITSMGAANMRSYRRCVIGG